MAWNNANELFVAGTGEVNVAPVGTALPTGPSTALNAAFFGLGYTTEEGLTFTSTPTITDFNAWQSNQAVRRELTAQELQAAFQLEQWNEESVPLAFGGGAITSVSGGYKYVFPAAGDAVDERSLVADVQDGTRVMRFVIPRGTVTESVETQFQRTALGVLPITFKALQPTDGSAICTVYFSDSTAFAAGS